MTRRHIVPPLIAAAFVAAACSTAGNGRPAPQEATSAPTTAAASPDGPDAGIDIPSFPAGAESVDLAESPASGSEVEIAVEDDAAAVVASRAPGTTFRFTEGVHREVSIAPRDGDVFLAQPGAVLSGAVVVDGFVADDGMYVAPVDAEPDEPYGQCRAATPDCGYRQELFVDGQPLRRVLDRDAVTEGTWMFDAEPGRVVLASDPLDATVELSVTTHAFTSTATDVTIDGVAIEHYANPAQSGVVHAAVGSARWTVRRCTIRDSHGAGLVVLAGSVVEGCRLSGNGQQGLGAGGADVRVTANTITANNRLGFDPGWSAGGAKFADIDGLEVTGNLVERNDGPGLWTDIDARNVLYADNQVHDNTGAGIFHEISYAAEITGNEVSGNGADSPGWLWGAGIQVAGSTDVTVEDNVVVDNRQGIVGVEQDRGSGQFGVYRLERLTVRHNTVVNSGQSGVAQDHSDPTVYERGNVFESNTYVGDVSWGWADQLMSWEQWQAEGNDVEGTYDR